MRAVLLLSICIALLLAVASSAYLRANGDEVVVNSNIGGSQRVVRATSVKSGSAILVYDDNNLDGSNTAVAARVYSSDAAGTLTAMGAVTQLNTATSDFQRTAASAYHSASDQTFVVWQSRRQESSTLGEGIYGQLLGHTSNTSLVKVGSEVHINNVTTDDQQTPAVAAVPSAAGTALFLVVWDSVAQDGSGSGIYAQVMGGAVATTPALVGVEMRVNVFTTNDQEVPAVAHITNGECLVAWTSSTQDTGGNPGIYGRMILANTAGATAISSEFALHVDPTLSQKSVALALLDSLRIAVVWVTTGRDAAFTDGVYARVMQYSTAHRNVSGLTGEIAVNNFTTGAQTNPAVAAISGGSRFVVAWQTPQDNSTGVADPAIFARAYSSLGAVLTDEQRISVMHNASQTQPTVAALSGDNFVVAWEALNQVLPASQDDVIVRSFTFVDPLSSQSPAAALGVALSWLL